MAPGGAVAIWHDIVPAGLDEFYAWHGEEHMPERVSIPGFLRGRRYSAIEADLGFFNLYETASPDVVRGPAYKARLDNPTQRTLSAVKHFRNVARSLCTVVATESAAESQTALGGLMATLRYDIAEGDEAVQLGLFRDALIPRLLSMRGIAGVMLLCADRAASGYANAEQRARGVANTVPPVTLIVEGWAGEAPFHARLAELLSRDPLNALGLVGDAVLGFYRHELTIARATPQVDHG